MTAVTVDRRALGDVIKSISVRGHQLTTDAYREQGQFPIVDQGRSETCGYTDEPLAIEGPLPLIVFGDHTREVKFIEQPFVVGADGVKLLSPADPELAPEYLFQLVKLAVTRLRSRGYARHFGDLCQLSVPVIRDKAVRSMVTRTLGCADSIIRSMIQLIEAKRTFKRGLTQQLLTGQKRFPQHRDTRWQIAALGDLVNYTPRKVPKPLAHFLSAGVRSHGKGVFLKEEFQSDGIALDELFELKHRDLVVNITFGWEGAVAIVPLEADGALVSHRFPTYEVDETKVLVEYLRHVIRSKRFVFDVGVASPGGAGRNRVLNRQEFLEITVKLPGIEEQGRIAQTLNDCDRELDLLAAQREQVENFHRALLSLLLSGSLPVPP